MTQTKLEKFFTLQPNTYNNSKKCFIYDPDKYHAFFDNNPNLDCDIFISKKSGIKIYYRKPRQSINFEFPIIDFKIPVPLLKSNLQKAIRRGKTQVALSSTLALLQISPVEFLRRLPIIFIEDVCLINTISIPVWLMMAEKDYKLSNMDIWIIMNIVKSLCDCKTFYNRCKTPLKTLELSHERLKDYKHKDELLSLYYRSIYGGMKGDMEMLTKSIYYYIENDVEIIEFVDFNITHNLSISNKIEILPESIDFHPFPQIINIIINNTKLDYKDIKAYIWQTESCVNIRKPYTINKSKKNINDPIWKRIKPELEKARKKFINY